MADIFDTLSAEEEAPAVDIFDQLAADPAGDIFDQLASTKPKPRDLLAQKLQDANLYGSATSAMGNYDPKQKLSRREDGNWDLPYMKALTGSFIGDALTGLGTLANQKLGRRSDAFLANNDEQSIQNVFHSFQQENNLSDDEVAAAWSDISSASRKFEGGEKARVLSDGFVLPNMDDADWLDDEKAKAIIESLPISQEAKDRELADLSRKQKIIAPQKLEAYSRAAYGTTMEAPDEWADRVGRQKDFGTKEFVRDYEAEVASKAGWGQGLGAGFHKGNLKLAMTLTGAAGYISGDKEIADEAASYAYASSMLSKGSFDTGLIGSLQEELPSLGAIIGASIVTGGIGGMVAGGGMTAASVVAAFTATAATAATGATVGSTIGMLGTSFIQSAGATFASSIQEGDTIAEAREKATKSGATTAIVTGLFQFAGMGGLEKSIVKASTGKKVADVTMRDMFNKMSAQDLGAAARAFTVDIAKAYGSEAVEEGADEAIQAFVTADPDTNLADAWSNAWEAAKIGGFIGSVAHVATNEIGGFVQEKNQLRADMLPETQNALQAQFDSTEADVPSKGYATEGALKVFAKRKLEVLRAKIATDPTSLSEQESEQLSFLEQNGEGKNWDAQAIAKSVNHTLESERTGISDAAMRSNAARPVLKVNAGIEGSPEPVEGEQTIDLPRYGDKGGSPIKVTTTKSGFAGMMEKLHGPAEDGREYGLQSQDGKEGSWSYAPHRSEPELDVVLFDKGTGSGPMSTGKAINRATGQIVDVDQTATKANYGMIRGMAGWTQTAKPRAGDLDTEAPKALSTKASEVYATLAPEKQKAIDDGDIEAIFDQKEITRLPDNSGYSVGGKTLTSQTTAMGSHKSLEFVAETAALNKSGGDVAKAQVLMDQWKADAAAGDVVHAGVSTALDGQSSGNANHDAIARHIQNIAGPDTKVHTEVKVADSQIAGTVDVVYKNSRGKWTIVDIKTMEIDPTKGAGKTKYDSQKALRHQVQTHGYASILAEQGIEVDEVLILPVSRTTGAMFPDANGNPSTINAAPSKQAVQILKDIRSGEIETPQPAAVVAEKPAGSKPEAPAPDAPAQDGAPPAADPESSVAPVSIDSPPAAKPEPKKDEIEIETKADAEAQVEREVLSEDEFGDVLPPLGGASSPQATSSTAPVSATQQRGRVVLDEGDKGKALTSKKTKSGAAFTATSGASKGVNITTEMDVGSAVIGTNKAGEISSVHVVTMKEPLPDGGFKYHLAAVSTKAQTVGSRGFKAKSVLGRLFGAINFYMPKSGIIDSTVDAVEAIAASLAKGEPINSPAALRSVEDMVRGQIAELAGASFATDNVIVTDETPFMDVVTIDNKPIVRINPAAIAADLHAQVGHEAIKNEAAFKFAAADYAELTAHRAFEEILHAYIAHEMTEAEVYDITQQSILAAKTNPALAASMRNSMAWRIRGMLTPAEIANLSPEQIDDLVTQKLDRTMAFNDDGTLKGINKNLSSAEYLGMGNEWLASLISRMMTGKDPSTVMADAGLSLANASKADTKLLQSVIDRVVELANRLVEAVRRLLDAQRLVNGDNVPKVVADRIKAVAALLEAGGVKAPDVMGVQESALSQQTLTLRGAAKHLRAGAEMAETQDKLREMVDTMRRSRSDASFLPVTLLNGRMVAAGVTDEEAAELNPLLDIINANGRPEMIARFRQAESDLDNILSLRSLGDPLFERRHKEVKRSGPDGRPISHTIESVVVNEEPIYRSIRKALEAESGQTLDSILERVNQSIDQSNSAVVAALKALSDKTAEMEKVVAVGDARLQALLDKRASIEQRIQALGLPPVAPGFTAAPRTAEELQVDQSIDPETDPTNLSKNLSVPTTEAQDRAWIAYQRQINRLSGFLADVNEAISKSMASFESRNKRNNIANPLSDSYYTMKDSEIGLRSALRDAQAASMPSLDGLSDLFGRYLSNPGAINNLVRDAFVDEKSSPSDQASARRVADKLTGALRVAAESATAAQRLLTFRNELPYFMLGGRTPRSIWNPSRTWQALDAARMPDNVSLMPIHVGPLALHSTSSIARLNPLAPTTIFSETSTFESMTIGSGNGAYDAMVERNPDGTLSFSTTDRNSAMNAIAEDVEMGYRGSFQILGVAQEYDKQNAFDEYGELLGPSERLDATKGNALAIARSLQDKMFDEFWQGNMAITDVALDMGGFQARYETHNGTRTLVVDDKLPYEADGSVLAGTDSNLDDMLYAGFFDKVVNGASNFVTTAQHSGGDYSRALLSHGGGLTPMGLAHSIVAPRLIRLLALTKGREVLVRHGLTDTVGTPIRLDVGDAKDAYDRLADGLSDSDVFANIAQKMTNKNGQISGSAIKAAVWDLHNAMKIANSLYRSAVRRAEDRTRSGGRYNQNAEYPLNPKTMSDVEFNRNIRSFQFLASSIDSKDKGKNAIISLIRPDEPMAFISQYNAITLERAALLRRGIDPSNPDKDTYLARQSGERDRAGRVEEDEVTRQQEDAELNQEKRDALDLSAWRSRALMAILGGNTERVRMFVADPRWATDDGGFDTDAMDSWVMDQLWEEHEAHKERGLIVPFGKNVSDGVFFDDAIRAEIPKSERYAAMLEAVLNTGGHVQMHRITPTASVDVERFQSGEDGPGHLVHALASTIQNLAVVDGKVRWESSQDRESDQSRIPTVAFVPSADAPMLVFPYGSSVEVKIEDATETIEEMLKWLAKHGNVDLVKQTNRLLRSMTEIGANPASLTRSLRERLAAEMTTNELPRTDAELDSRATQLAIAAKLYASGMNASSSAALDRITDRAAAMFFDQNNRHRVRTANQAAKVLATLLTDVNAKQAFALSIYSAPTTGPISPEAVAMRGELITMGALPIMRQAAVEDELQTLEMADRIARRKDDGSLKDDWQPSEGEVSEDAVNSILEKASGSKGASPIADIQVQWANELLHSVLDNLAPSWTGFEPDPLGGPAKGADAPRGLAYGQGDGKPLKLTKFEARQLMARFPDGFLSSALGNSDGATGWNGAGAKSLSVDELMRLSGDEADQLRAIFSAHAPFETGNRYQEDQALHYKQWSFARMGGSGELWMHGRIRKGVFPEALADGAVESKANEFSDATKLSMYVPADGLRDIVRQRREEGREIQREMQRMDADGNLLFEDGNGGLITESELIPVTATLRIGKDGQRDQWSNGQVITGLPYTQTVGWRLKSNSVRGQNESLANFNRRILESDGKIKPAMIAMGDLDYEIEAKRRRDAAVAREMNDMQSSAAQSAARVAKLKADLLEIEKIGEELLLTQDVRQANEILGRSTLTTTDGHWSSLNKLIRHSFEDGPELAGRMASQLVDDYADSDLSTLRLVSLPFAGNRVARRPQIARSEAPAAEPSGEKTPHETALENRWETIRAEREAQLVSARATLQRATLAAKASQTEMSVALSEWEASKLPVEGGEGIVVNTDGRPADPWTDEQVDASLAPYRAAVRDAEESLNFAEGDNAMRESSAQITPMTPLFQEIASLSRSAIDASTVLIEMMDQAVARLNDARSAAEAASTPDEVQSAKDELWLSQRSLRIRSARWNKHARDYARAINSRIPGLVGEGRGQLWQDPRDLTESERSQAIARFRERAADLIRDARSLSTTRAFVFTLQRQLADQAVDRLRSFDQSGGLSSMDFSDVSNQDNVRIPAEASDAISRILTDNTLGRGEKQAAIQAELQQALFPHEAQVARVTSTLRSRLQEAKDRIDNNDSDVNALVFDVFRELNKMRASGELDDLSANSENIIGLDVAKQIVSSHIKREHGKARKMVRAAIKERSDYKHRSSKVFAPRGKEAGKLEYIGDEDAIEILRRNHEWRAQRWEANYMQSLDRSNLLDGYAAAVEAAKDADERAAAMRDYMEAFSNEPYQIVNGFVGPVSRPVPDRVKLTKKGQDSGLVLGTVGGLSSNAMTVGKILASRAMNGAYAAMRSKSVGVFFDQKTQTIEATAKQMGQFDPRAASRTHLEFQIASLRDAIDNAQINSPALLTQTTSLLQALSTSTTPSEAVVMKIGPTYRMVNAEIISRAAAANLSDGYMPSRRWKGKTTPFSKTSAFELAMHEDAAVRQLFSIKDAAIDQASEILGLLGHGETGNTGLIAYRAQKNALSHIFDKKHKEIFGSRFARGVRSLNPMEKDDGFYEASMGYMFYAIKGYMSSKGWDNTNNRGKALQRMFDDAENGINEALTKGIPQNVGGFSPADLLKLGLPQLRRQAAKLKAYMTNETYMMLEQRQVLQRLRGEFENALNIAASTDSTNTQNALGAMEAALPKRAKEWGRFVNDQMEMLKRTYIEQAKLDGQNTMYMEHSNALGFSWQTFGTVFSTSKSARPLNERMGWAKASFMQPATRPPSLDEINMLDVNGLSVPLQMADDLLFRMNVTPAYESFRAIVGSTSVTNDALTKVEDNFGYLDEHAGSLNPAAPDMLKDASNAIAHLGQRILTNELAAKAARHRLMDAVQKLQMLGAIKALLSVSQIYIQTLPGALAYSAVYSKGNGSFPGLYMSYLASRGVDAMGKLAGRITGNQPSDSLAKQIDDFVALRGTNVHIRTLNGERDFFENIGAIRPTKNYLRDVSGMMIRGSMELGARGLQAVLGGAEKTFANTIFTHAVLKGINEARLANDPSATLMTMSEMVDRNASHSEITSAVLSSAEREVNDMIATGVTSKKASLFQQSDSTLRETLRMGLVTFSNHQVHLSANSVAARDMIRFGDEKARAKGARLLATNITQNVLFRLTKYTMATKLLAMAVGALAGWDEEERDAFYAKFFGIDVNNPDERTAMSWIALTMGGSSPLGWSEKDEEFTKDKKNAAFHRAIQDIAMEGIKQAPLGNLGLFASTNYGSMITNIGVSKLVDPFIEGHPAQFDRAGYTMKDADISDGEGMDNLAYNSSAFLLNDLANLSLVLGGISHMVDPVVMASNAEEVEPLDMALLLFSSAPFVPREFQSKLEKNFAKKTDAKIWSSQWKR